MLRNLKDSRRRFYLTNKFLHTETRREKIIIVSRIILLISFMLMKENAVRRKWLEVSETGKASFVHPYKQDLRIFTFFRCCKFV